MVARWERKKPATAGDGPLEGDALRRLRSMDTSTLYDWADASVSKIGRLLLDGRRHPEYLPEAELETRALLQALEEISSR